MKMKLTIFLILFFKSCTYAQVSDFKTINFTRADNLAKLNEGSSLENLTLLAHKLTYKLPTQVEKFRAIYIWVCNNIKADMMQQNKIERKRKRLKNDSASLLQWNNAYKKHAFKKLLKHKKTVCTGYAYLIKELCYLANIECVIVNGYGRLVDSNVNELEKENHSWNALKLNDKWYLCDATWSSGYFDETNTFIKHYNDGYFLTAPILFNKNHYPLQQKWMLDNVLTVSEFVTAPLLYGEAFENKVILLSPEKMNVLIKKNEEVRFSVKSVKQISSKSVSLVCYIGVKEIVFDIYNIKNENGLISFNYKFKSKGAYDVHLKIKDDIVATYTVKVSKK